MNVKILKIHLINFCLRDFVLSVLILFLYYQALDDFCVLEYMKICSKEFPSHLTVGQFLSSKYIGKCPTGLVSL